MHEGVAKHAAAVEAAAKAGKAVAADTEAQAEAGLGCDGGQQGPRGGSLSRPGQGIHRPRLAVRRTARQTLRREDISVRAPWSHAGLLDS